MSQNLKTHHFDSQISGPHLLIFGAIHGDETCGTVAIEQCARMIEEGWLSLQAGRLTMIPVCNMKAFEQKKRFTEQNLNRVFKKHAHPESYEAQLANMLTGYVDECDFLLDLHSQSSAGMPFVFQDYEDDKTENFARALGVETVLKGWPEMFSSEADLNAGDTNSYAYSQGKAAVLLECGQHKDPRAPGVAYLAIINSLIHCGMIAAPEISVATQHQIIRGKTVFAVPAEGGQLVKKWKHLQDICQGQELAVTGTGEPIIAPYDGVIILPKYAAKPKEEWFYMGQREMPAP